MFATDTHPLVWYVTAKHSFLSAKAVQAFKKAEAGEALIHVPSIVLLETAMLNASGKVRLGESFERWAERLLASRAFSIVDLEIKSISLAVGYSFNNDIFDKAIVATAVSMDLPLITKDVAISESGLVEIYW